MKNLVNCLLAATVLTGCVGGPGAPMVRTDSRDGQGALILGCANLSPSDRTDDFIRGFYLTTWKSAGREGTAAGIAEAAGGGQFGRQLADGVLPASETFCREVPGTMRDAYRVAKQLLQEFGYRIDYADKQGSFLTTDYVYQSRLPSHQWKDRYAVAFEPMPGGNTAVHVLREVYISRCTGKPRVCSDYLRATSVGHNEAAILNIISKRLQASGHAERLEG